MKFRRTTGKDIEGVMLIIKQAQEYLKSQDVDQWQDGYPNAETIKDDIEKEWSYVLIKECEIVATAAISFDGEETYDIVHEGGWITDDEYAVIHRIAVHDGYKGQGLSSIMLNNIEELCIEKGVNSIKIDTHEENISMQRLLKKNDFQYCGVIYLEDKSKRIVFEKTLSS